MKKLFLLMGIGAIASLTSCVTPKAAKEAVGIGKQVRGSWTLTTVDYNGFSKNEVQGNVKVNETVANVFDTASPECYEGSTWDLVQNNKTGIYRLNNTSASCPQVAANIIWNIQQDGPSTYFIFKDVTGIKAKQNTAGYKLKVEYVDANSMRLVQDVNASGKIAQVIYNFQR